MSEPLKGSCLCGAISFETRGDAVLVGNCHCTDCQKSTGAGHATIAGFPAAQVSLTGTPKGYAKQADSGNAVTRFFCPDCGSPLYSEVEAMPGVQFFKLGAFDTCSALAPTVSLYTKSAKGWDAPADGLPGFDTMPG